MLYCNSFLKTRSIYLITLLFLSFQLVSCVTTQQSYRIQPEFINTIKNVKSIGVIVPSCIVKDLAIGGAATIDKGASEAAKPIMERGVIGGLEKKGFKGWLITNDKDRQTFFKNFTPIAREIKNHFPGGETQPTVPSKIDGFDDILKNNNIDCILAVEGLEHISTPGRKAMMVARTATILLGLGMVGGSGYTYISYSLFCADGKPMYYDMTVDTSTSIANQEDVAGVVSGITEKMMQVTELSKPAQLSPPADAPKQASMATQPINQPVVAGDGVAKNNVENTELKTSSPATTESTARDDVAKMEKLKNMRDRGLITEEEYNGKKKEILDKM